jgi:hypothetical protein
MQPNEWLGFDQALLLRKLLDRMPGQPLCRCALS